MAAQIDRIVADLEEAQRRLHRLAERLPDERFARRNDPARWSIAENVAHLNLTSVEYLPVIRDGLVRAAGMGGADRYRMDPAGWLLSKLVGPLPKLGGRPIGRMRTPASFVPSGDSPPAEIMADFDRLQAEQIGLAREGDGLRLDRVRISSPFDARVSYNLYSALVILARHQLRHVEQAESVWGM